MKSAERAPLVLSRQECVRLLADSRVGRAVFNERALPAVIPIAFALHDDAIVMCTGSDTRLAEAADRGVLAFEVDDIDSSTHSGWSVVVTGVAELVHDSAERSRIRCLSERWTSICHDVVVRLPLTVVTGRRIVASGPDVVGIAAYT